MVCEAYPTGDDRGQALRLPAVAQGRPFGSFDKLLRQAPSAKRKNLVLTSGGDKRKMG